MVKTDWPHVYQELDRQGRWILRCDCGYSREVMPEDSDLEARKHIAKCRMGYMRDWQPEEQLC